MLALPGDCDLQRDRMRARPLGRHIHRQFSVSLNPLEFAFMAQYLDGADLDRLLCAFRRERLDACPELVGSPSQTGTESCP